MDIEFATPRLRLMSPSIIVSYDGTDNDRDALALGRLLRDAGAPAASPTCATRRASDPVQEILEAQQAAKLLERAAHVVGAPAVRAARDRPRLDRRGPARARRPRGTDIVVFGSGLPHRGRHRPSRHVGPAPAQRRPDRRRARARRPARPPARDRARRRARRGRRRRRRRDRRGLARALGPRSPRPASRSTSSSSARGRSDASGASTLSAVAEYEIETSAVPVLVVPRGAAVHFPEPTLAAA